MPFRGVLREQKHWKLCLWMQLLKIWQYSKWLKAWVLCYQNVSDVEGKGFNRPGNSTEFRIPGTLSHSISEASWAQMNVALETSSIVGMVQVRSAGSEQHHICWLFHWVANLEIQQWGSETSEHHLGAPPIKKNIKTLTTVEKEL